MRKHKAAYRTAERTNSPANMLMAHSSSKLLFFSYIVSPADLFKYFTRELGEKSARSPEVYFLTCHRSRASLECLCVVYIYAFNRCFYQMRI